MSIMSSISQLHPQYLQLSTLSIFKTLVFKKIHGFYLASWTKNGDVGWDLSTIVAPTTCQGVSATQHCSAYSVEHFAGAQQIAYIPLFSQRSDVTLTHTEQSLLIIRSFYEGLIIFHTSISTFRTLFYEFTVLW